MRGLSRLNVAACAAGVTVPRRKLERLAEVTAAAGAWLLLDNTYGEDLACYAVISCVAPCFASGDY